MYSIEYSAETVREIRRRGVGHGEEHSEDGQADAPEDRRERQAIPLRKVPQAKPETCKDGRPLVLLKLLERERPLGPMKLLLAAFRDHLEGSCSANR